MVGTHLLVLRETRQKAESLSQVEDGVNSEEDHDLKRLEKDSESNVKQVSD